MPVWGDVELAYRLRPAGQEWLGVTGTNGKTTTVQMLASILRAAGHRAVATGNVGFPVLDAVLADPPYDVLAVEVSSFQLHWTSTVEFISGAVLNIAPDHLDWHGSLEAYAADKALVWRSDWYAVYNADDPLVAALVARRSRTRQSFSLRATPRAGFALVGDQLVDRGIGTDPGEQVERVRRRRSRAGRAGRHPGARPAQRGERPGRRRAGPLAAQRDRRPARGAPGRRAGGSARVRPRRAPHRPRRHGRRRRVRRRLEGDQRARCGGVAVGVPAVVWVAGGLAKGATFDELVTGAAARLRGVVLIGRDRALIAEALARHAPEIPVVEVTGTDTGPMQVAAVMDDVVRAAAALARPGDTVLLAPACASMDMFRDYAERGDAFADAVRRLPGGQPQ